MDIVCRCLRIVIQPSTKLCSSVGTKIRCVDQHSRRSNGSSKTSSRWTKATTKKLIHINFYHQSTPQSKPWARSVTNARRRTEKFSRRLCHLMSYLIKSYVTRLSRSLMIPLYEANNWIFYTTRQKRRNELHFSFSIVQSTFTLLLQAFDDFSTCLFLDQSSHTLL